MTRGVALVLALWTVAASGWYLFFGGPQTICNHGGVGETTGFVPTCGPVPAQTDVDRIQAIGPVVLIVVLLAGWSIIMLVARLRQHQAG